MGPAGLWDYQLSELADRHKNRIVRAVTTAAQAAEDRLFEVLSEEFRDVPGDFPPDAAMALNLALVRAAMRWLDLNLPGPGGDR